MFKLRGVFTIGVPKGNDLFLKDRKGQIWDFCLSHVIVVGVDCCMLIGKMMSC